MTFNPIPKMGVLWDIKLYSVVKQQFWVVWSHAFIAITLISTLIRNRSTCSGPMYNQIDLFENY